MLPQYLYKNKSSTSYFFVAYIPLDLLHFFEGRKMFRLSLKCANKVESKKLCLFLNQKLQTLYEQIRMGKSLTIDEMKRILKKEIEKSKKHSSYFSYVGVDRSKEKTKQEGLERLDREEKQLKERNKNDFDDEVEKLLKEEGITRNADRKGDYFRVFRENYIKVQSLKIKWKRELLLGETKSDFDLVSQILEGGFDNPELDRKNAFARDTHLQPVIENSAPEPKEPYLVEVKLISDIAEDFLTIKKGTIGEKLLEEYKVIISDFLEIIGDISANNLSKDSIRKYISTQLKLPSNRRKNPKYRDLSIEKVIKLKDVEPQSRLNVNKYLMRLTTFINFGVGQGYFKENYIIGMKLPVPKKEGRKKREPFSQEDISKILSPKTYLSWTANYKIRISNQHKTVKTDKNAINQPALYWTFLCGILSGMRTNEFAQLKIQDIFQEDRIWMFSVDEEMDKSVKTRNSIRKFPIHPTLIELGFLNYVEIIKSKGNDRVFPQLMKGRDGYAAKLSRHYNEKFLPEIGVWKSKVKVLYCTRHTFINRCYMKGVDKDIIKSIVGHEPDFTFGVYGGNVFPPKQLYNEISKVSYPNIRWNRLKVDWKKQFEK